MVLTAKTLCALCAFAVRNKKRIHRKDAKNAKKRIKKASAKQKENPLR